MKDIDPYICLFESCNKPNENFSTIENWLSHMKWQHTIVWSCPTAQQRSELLNSQDDFESHMREEHAHEFTESQLPMLLQKCAQPSADPFTVLSLQSDNHESENTQICPPCPFSTQSSNTRSQGDSSLLGAEIFMDGIDKTIRNHVAAHLESIALLSLPEQNDVENAASNELQSESAKHSSRQDDDDLPAAIFDDNPFTRPIIDPALSDLAIHVPPDSEPEYWSDYVSLEWHKRSDDLVPGEDPTLQGFVERARYIQMMELRQKLVLPLIVVNDPDGLEVAEYKWMWGVSEGTSTASEEERPVKVQDCAIPDRNPHTLEYVAAFDKPDITAEEPKRRQRTPHVYHDPGRSSVDATTEAFRDISKIVAGKGTRKDSSSAEADSSSEHSSISKYSDNTTTNSVGHRRRRLRNPGSAILSGDTDFNMHKDSNDSSAAKTASQTLAHASILPGIILTEPEGHHKRRRLSDPVTE